MVDSTPNKPLFEGNYPSNAETLFFEFAFEPTPFSFTPQPDLLTTAPLAKAKRKTYFLNASKLAFGLLVTALLMSSGILNNQLFNGAVGNQASLTLLPAWADDVPTANNTATAVVATSKLAEEKPENQENMTFAPTAEPESVADLTTSIPTSVDKVESGAEPKARTTKGERPLRPMIKKPVSREDIKLSEPVVNRTTAQTNKLEITSEAFHAVNEKSALDGKKVFIKFGARWCLPCKMMEANVFPDPEIRQALAENYHVLDVDVDNIDGINLRQMYKVEALPSFIILDKHQNIVGRHEGAKRIDELRSILGPVTP